MKLTKAYALIIVGILVVISVAVAYAVYTMNSNTINVPVSEQATLSLTVNLTTTITATRYDNLTLRAVCSDGAYNGLVTFLDTGVQIGQVQAVAGLATFTYNVTQAKLYAFSATGSHN